jgi:hypothetical protein
LKKDTAVTRVWMYVLDSSKDPDNVRCVVPWMVDESLIYFGPCKRRLREQLRRKYLTRGRTHSTVNDDLYIVSVNGSNAKRVRKVVSAGKLSEVMTFAEAAGRLDGDRFSEVRNDLMSPLHVRPVIEGGSLVGYRHISFEHIEDNEWIADLTSKPEKVSLVGRTIRLQPGATARDVLDRDCCMVLDNVFFAQGEGIQFDQEAVSILKATQPGVKGIDDYAVFGVDSVGQANGLRGRFLEIEGMVADRFVAWLTDRATRIAARRSGGEEETAKGKCRPRGRCRNLGIC